MARMNKSLVSGMLVLLIFYKVVLAILPNDSSMPISKIVLAEAMQPHEKFFDVYRNFYANSTMNYSLENDGISSVICFPAKPEVTCISLSYEISQNVTHKICNSTVNFTDLYNTSSTKFIQSTDSDASILYYKYTDLQDDNTASKLFYVSSTSVIDFTVSRLYSFLKTMS